MIDLATLEGMTEEDLQAWLLECIRGESDPPISTMHLETPLDFVCSSLDQLSVEFAARYKAAILRLLTEVTEAKVWDRQLVHALSFLVDKLDMHEAAPILHKAAVRGNFGGHSDVLQEIAEGDVLHALAGLQPPDVYWQEWVDLWQNGPSFLWTVTVLGMRRSNPVRATTLLGEIVGQMKDRKTIPLGMVLWGFGKDPGVEVGAVLKELEVLKKEELQRCRRGLRFIGATEEEINAWVPSVD